MQNARIEGPARSTTTQETVPSGQTETLGAEELKRMTSKVIEHKQYIARHGDDMPDVKDL